MSVHVITSAKGSPGVTTSALALAWAWPTAHPGRRVVVVDADMAGSGIIPGYLRAAVPPDAGLLTFVHTGAGGGDHGAALVAASVAMDDSGDRLLLPGITDPSQSRALEGFWALLADTCTELSAAGVDVLLDAGRLATGLDVHQHGVVSAFIASGAGVVLGVRSTLVSVAAARPVLRRLHNSGATPRVLVVGDGHPYTLREIRSALDTEDVLSLPWDPSAARVFSDGAQPGWRVARSAFTRSARATATELTLSTHAASTHRTADVTTIVVPT